MAQCRTPQPVLAPVIGGNLMRWLVLLLLTPTLVLGIFKGTTLVSHTHDDHQLHLHVFQNAAAAKQASCSLEHAARHGHGHDDEAAESSSHDHSSPTAGELCLSLTLSLPDHQPLPSAGATVVKTVAAAPAICCDFPPLDRAQYHAVRPSTAPIDDAARGPAPPRATDRLVRTSRALLL